MYDFWKLYDRHPKLSMRVFGGIILRNPQNGSDYKGFVWEFR